MMATDFGYVPFDSKTELLRLKIMACHGLSKKDRYYVQIHLGKKIKDTCIGTITNKYILKNVFNALLLIIFLLVDNNNMQVGVPILTECTEPTLYPCWNEMFMVKVPHRMDFKILFQVFDKDNYTRDDLVGQVEIPLQNIAKEELGIKFWEIKEGQFYEMGSSDGWLTLLGKKSIQAF